ncbi:4'-phosphopantetheinyl transferase superfamily protein [Rossellomorea vietnamensis]|uniref:4'-phosphopantetheinyl transferase superfamily protein n=1 Tax=Rossellomorea vietnamensis TaxID=218284 RepID=A0A5D4NJC4_9BACI|nr:4'-phosphopantetheinyl transferase superfamily protein [Rossellomorea vietnamensis]TYS13042.1 4'-phosphopantetheinyl transferase superfamily protein [Rossellomorea vietnamensis]
MERKKHIVKIYVLQTPPQLQMDSVKGFINILDNSEKKIYNNFLVEKRKIEFLLGRILLKVILSEELNTSISRIMLEKNYYGKLYLSGSIDKGPLFFNLSHTNGMLVCGVNRMGEIGVDVERVEKNILNVMNGIFLSDEVNYVKSQETLEKSNVAFFKVWTRKESYMKLKGKGFSIDPKSFLVPCTEGYSQTQNIFYESLNYSNKFMISTAVNKVDPNIRPNFIFKTIDYNKLLNSIKNLT